MIIDNDSKFSPNLLAQLKERPSIMSEGPGFKPRIDWRIAVNVCILSFSQVCNVHLMWIPPLYVLNTVVMKLNSNTAPAFSSRLNTTMLTSTNITPLSLQYFFIFAGCQLPSNTFLLDCVKVSPLLVHFMQNTITRCDRIHVTHGSW